MSRNHIPKELVSHVMHLAFHVEDDETPLKYSKWESDTIRCQMSYKQYSTKMWEMY